MSTGLGPYQRAALKALKERGPWPLSGRWCLVNRSRTIRVLDSLVERGLVKRDNEYVYHLVDGKGAE
jgi:DNA-binding IclR family transcriptional regulator